MAWCRPGDHHVGRLQIEQARTMPLGDKAVEFALSQAPAAGRSKVGDCGTEQLVERLPLVGHVLLP